MMKANVSISSICSELKNETGNTVTFNGQQRTLDYLSKNFNNFQFTRTFFKPTHKPNCKLKSNTETPKVASTTILP